MRSEAAAGSLAHALDIDMRAEPVLTWRWKVDRVVARADMTRKSGDDFAARVYVFFDVPIDELPFAQRLKIRVTRALFGADLPTAAICYVWDNSHAPETFAPNPYSERVRMIVVESGGAQVARWVTERRDVERDFRKAFGIAADAPVPRVSGIGLGADTDQTGESVTAWFGDVRFEPRR